MTPLARFLARFLPARTVWLALAVIYAIGLAAVILVGGKPPGGIVYIDISQSR